MRRLGLLVMTALLTTATAATAQPRAASPMKAARAKRPVGTLAATVVARSVAQPTLDPAAAAILADAKAFAKSSERKEAVSTTALLQEYQRVGRALLLLPKECASCTGLQSTFRSIKIDDAIATAESRVETAKALDELRGKIDRLR
jgi:hypothetical protein